MNGVEQRNGLLGLVGLQWPDQMQREAGINRHQPWPLRLGLLHAILAEYALSGLDHRRDCGGIESLGYRDQRHRRGVPSRFIAGARNLLLPGRKPVWLM